MAGAVLITEGLTIDEKFQRPHSDAGPDLVRLMLAPSRRMEAMTNLPPSSDQMLGATSMEPGSWIYTTGSMPMAGSS